VRSETLVMRYSYKLSDSHSLPFMRTYARGIRHDMDVKTKCSCASSGKGWGCVVSGFL
jgi:hypothetical protein